MSAPEFSMMMDLRQLPAAPVVLAPDEAQRAALARRFSVTAIPVMRATVTLEPAGPGVSAQGRLTAQVLQQCAVSGDDIETTIDEPVNLRFVPPGPEAAPDAEIEIDADECDEIAFEGERFDLGEAISQTLGLAIDPFATGPAADLVRKEHGLSDESAAGPFAALAALRKDN